MRKLGCVQRGCLESLVRHGSWYSGHMCGWVWDNRSGTIRILKSLVKRGYAKIDTITLTDGTLYHGAFVPTRKGADYVRVSTNTHHN